MSIFAWLSLFSLIATLILGIVVYYKNPKNIVNRFFLFLCLFLSYWAFAEFGSLQADTLDNTIFWMKSSSFWPMLAPIMMQFVLIFTGQSRWLKNKGIFFLLYAPALVFSLLFLITNDYVLIRGDWGWVRYETNSLFFDISNIWFSGLTILIIYLLFRFYFKKVDYRTKQQAKYILLGFFIPIAESIIITYLPREFHIPDFTSTGVVIGCVFIGYGIWKYGLFMVSPTTAAESIISTMSDALVLTDVNGKITSVNQAALGLLGWEKSKVIGQTFDFISTCPMDEIAKKEVINDFETGFKIKTGKIVPISLSSSTLRSKKRDLQGFVIIGRDITERKKMEDEVRNNTEHLQQMNFKLNSMNEELTATNEELITTQSELKEKNDRLEQMNLDLNAMNEELTATNQELIGAQKELEKKATELKSLNKELLVAQEEREDYVAQLEEKTEALEEMNEKISKSEHKIKYQNVKLRKLDQLKSAFLNITSHELRTPMSSIKGYVQMSLKGVLGTITEEQKKSLEVVLRNTERLDHLIQDILDISRLESGTMKFIPEKINIKHMISEITETMQSSADTKKIKINTDVIGEIPDLVVDQDRIKQVISNLLNNAIKFSSEESVISVCATEKDNDVLVEVEDLGRGIPKSKQKHVFETFYQVDSGMDRKFGGAGLGLSISRGIILAHGGRIWVESEGVPGKGSVFKFTLPVVPVQDVEGRFKKVDVFKLENIL